jgi:sporulation related protein
VSTVTPPPHDAAVPPAPPERRCPRCGSTLAPDQEWCLACGAAAETEIAEPRGWRVPIMLSGGLGLLALIGVVLLIIALANGPEKVATETPAPSAAAPLPTTTPGPTTTATPLGTTTPAPGATVTPSPSAAGSPTPIPTTTPSPSPSGTTGSFPGWTGGDGWTIIIESATTQSKAESVASDAQGAGETVGILKSDDYSSLNAGYWVVFTGHYTSKSEAQSQLDAVRAQHGDAYVRHIVQ